VTIRVKEWLGRLGEIAANFLLPGLGGLIFDRSNRRNSLWQMVLSVAGLILAWGGLWMILMVLGISFGATPDRQYVADALQQPEELYKILMGLAGVILGGVLILGGFLWSLDNAMKRWSSSRAQPPESAEISGTE
jgi:hypothetical protein